MSEKCHNKNNNNNNNSDNPLTSRRTDGDKNTQKPQYYALLLMEKPCGSLEKKHQYLKRDKHRTTDTTTKNGNESNNEHKIQPETFHRHSHNLCALVSHE